jgi:hypothetical protein
MVLLMLFRIPRYENKKKCPKSWYFRCFSSFGVMKTKKSVLNHDTFDAFPHSSSQKKKILLNHDSFDAFPHSSS